MSMAPFSARPLSSHGSERSRTRLVLAIATVGIAATLLAYAVSPGVRHVVGHAAHSVKHAVGGVFPHHHHRHRQPLFGNPGARRNGAPAHLHGAVSGTGAVPTTRTIRPQLVTPSGGTPAGSSAPQGAAAGASP